MADTRRILLGRSRCRPGLLLSGLLLLSALAAISHAQITLDGSLGPGGPLPGPHYRIDAELGQIRGSNLFHSFGQFNVPTGGSATFRGPAAIENIVSRVTGGQQSFIDGQLRSTIAGAHLYLLNPSGVLFGSNASLDIRGAFHVSTADVLRFADGATFFANLGQESVLTVASPVAFGFLGATPTPISIQESVLEVPTGKALSVVGGDITIVGGPLGVISAPSGRIQLASVASPGEVIFSPLALAPDLQVDSFVRLGKIELSQLALLDASGDNGGGTVLLRSGQLRVDRSFIFADTRGDIDGASLGIDLQVRADARIMNDSVITTNSLGAGRAGELRITAGSLHMDDALLDASGNGGGTVLLRSGQLRVDRSFIFADNTGRVDGSGVGLDLRITGDAIIANGSLLTTDSLGAGRARELRLTAGSLQMDNALIHSFAESRGNAGTIHVEAGTLTLTGGVPSVENRMLSAGILSGTSPGSRGNAGAIHVEAGTLRLTGGAQIASLAQGSGNGSDVTVLARESVAVSGQNTQGSPSGIVSFAAGEPGRLFLSAPTVTIDGGLIGTPSIAVSGFVGGRAGDTVVKADTLTVRGRGQITSSTATDSAGGSITIEAGRLMVSGGARISSSTSGLGDAGRITISAPLLTMDDSLIQAGTGSGSRGHAGNIEMQVGRLMLTGGAQISSSTLGAGRGGEVTVVATEAITIAGRNEGGLRSGLFSNAQSGSGHAGNLSISTPTLTMRDRGVIVAETSSSSSGHAGNIEVQVGRLALSEGAQISSSSVGVGRGGNVTVAGTEQIELSQGGTISASSSGQGEAGHIVIRAGQLFRSRNGAVTTEAARAGGGTIALHAGRLVQLQDSEVTTSVRGGGGDAGNLTLESSLVIAEGSQMVANAFEGRGGNIGIGAEVFLADPASLVSASSALGIQGTVNIQAPVTSLSGTLAPLPQAFMHVAALLPARCAARLSGGQTSSLVVGGRDGLPLEPGGLLPSPLVLAPRMEADPAVTGAPPQSPFPSGFALLQSADKGFPRLRCPK